LKKKLEDNKGVIRRCKSKKDIHKKRKRTKEQTMANKTKQKNKHWTTRTSHKT